MPNMANMNDGFLHSFAFTHSTNTYNMQSCAMHRHTACEHTHTFLAQRIAYECIDGTHEEEKSVDACVCMCLICYVVILGTQHTCHTLTGFNITTANRIVIIFILSRTSFFACHTNKPFACIYL